jgi:nucleolin
MMFTRQILLAVLARTTSTLAFNAPLFTVQRHTLGASFVSSQSLLAKNQPRYLTAVFSTDTDAIADSGETEVVAEETASEEVAEESSEEATPVDEDADLNKKLFVGNLPIEFTQETIVELFESYGPVSEISVPTDRFTGAIRGFAFLTLSSEEMAQKAIDEMNESDVQGRIITVKAQLKPGEQKPKKKTFQAAEGTKLYVGNLPFDVERDDIMEYFGQYGTVNDCFIPIDRDQGRPRGFAFVTMAKEDVDAAISATNGIDFMGRNLQVNVSLPRGEAPPNRRSQNKTKLYVGNMSYDTDEETLRSLFQDYGEILDIYIPMDRETGRMRGFAFVTMEPEAAERAVEETDGFELYGRVLRVNEAQPKGRASQGGGFQRNDSGYDNGGGWDDSY